MLRNNCRNNAAEKEKYIQNTIKSIILVIVRRSVPHGKTQHDCAREGSRMKKPHYAWVVLAGCTLLFFTIAGLSGNCYPVYSPFIMKQYGFSKTMISLIGSVSSLSSTLSIILTAYFYKKISLRNGILISGLLNAAAYFLFGIADSYPAFLAASALKGFSYGLGSLVPIAMIIENWFSTGRTLALSVVSAASGLATVGVPSLITWVIKKYGIHTSFLATSAVFAVLYLISWLLIRSRPEDLSLTAYAGKDKKRAGKGDTDDTSVHPLPDRWWLFLTFSIIAATTLVTCYSSLSMFSSVEGISSETVALVVSTAGASLMIGKLLYGTVSAAIGQKTTSLVFGFTGVAGLLMCCLVSIDQAFLFAGTVCIGISTSSLVVGSVSWVNDWAEPGDRAEHVKIFQSAYNIGSLINGLLAGLMADIFGGSYKPFYAFSAFVAVGFVLTVNAAYVKQKRYA